MTVTGTNGKKYELDNQPFAAGGEGNVFNVTSDKDYVVKIFHQTISDETELKLKTIVGTKNSPNGNATCAWPIDIIFDVNKKCIGFVMVKAKGEKLIDILEKHYCLNDYIMAVKTAVNIAGAVDAVHSMDQIIGDLNPRNILVDKSACVTLIDTDSFHITAKTASGKKRVLRCKVTTPLYTPHELQGIHFPSAPLPTFSKNSDRFSLAILIFQLLMNSVHPHTCRKLNTFSESFTRFQAEPCIAVGLCPFFRETLQNRKGNIGIPMHAPSIESLPSDIVRLFKRAFVDGHSTPDKRPSAREWVSALNASLNKLKLCDKNTRHRYFTSAKTCPWCEIEKKMTASSTVVKNARRNPLNTQGALSSGISMVATKNSVSNIAAIKLAGYIITTALLAAISIFLISRYFVSPFVIPNIKHFDGSTIWSNLLNAGKQIIPIALWLGGLAAAGITQYYLYKKKKIITIAHCAGAIAAAPIGSVFAMGLTYAVLGLIAALAYLLIIGLILGVAGLILGG